MIIEAASIGISRRSLSALLQTSVLIMLDYNQNIAYALADLVRKSINRISISSIGKQFGLLIASWAKVETVRFSNHLVQLEPAVT
jgi:hypothetical protein